MILQQSRAVHCCSSKTNHSCKVPSVLATQAHMMLDGQSILQTFKQLSMSEVYKAPNRCSTDPGNSRAAAHTSNAPGGDTEKLANKHAQHVQYSQKRATLASSCVKPNTQPGAVVLEPYSHTHHSVLHH